MATTNIMVPMAMVMKNMTMNVTIKGVRLHRFRIWAGVQLMRLAARVIGCGFNVNLEES